MNFGRKMGLLLVFIGVCAGASILSCYQQFRSERVKPAELYAVINRQLGALRASDYPGAYRQASAIFKQKCDLAQFAAMIHREYPLLARTEEVEFGQVENDGRHALIPVYFISRNNEAVACIYTLVEEGGDWKIENIRLLHRKDSKLMLNGILS